MYCFGCFCAAVNIEIEFSQIINIVSFFAFEQALFIGAKW